MAADVRATVRLWGQTVTWLRYRDNGGLSIPCGKMDNKTERKEIAAKICTSWSARGHTLVLMPCWHYSSCRISSPRIPHTRCHPWADGDSIKTSIKLLSALARQMTAFNAGALGFWSGTPDGWPDSYGIGLLKLSLHLISVPPLHFFDRQQHLVVCCFEVDDIPGHQRGRWRLQCAYRGPHTHTLKHTHTHTYTHSSSADSTELFVSNGLMTLKCTYG